MFPNARNRGKPPRFWATARAGCQPAGTLSLGGDTRLPRLT